MLCLQSFPDGSWATYDMSGELKPKGPVVKAAAAIPSLKDLKDLKDAPRSAPPPLLAIRRHRAAERAPRGSQAPLTKAVNILCY